MKSFKHTTLYYSYRKDRYLNTLPSATSLPPKSPSHNRNLLIVCLFSSLSGSNFVKEYDGASTFQSSASCGGGGEGEMQIKCQPYQDSPQVTYQYLV